MGNETGTKGKWVVFGVLGFGTSCIVKLENFRIQEFMKIKK
jgi:hypothetical protein